MYVLQLQRQALLQFLPENGVVAEICVAEGNFSEHILTTTKPSKLHLIDPWEHQVRSDYKFDPNNVLQDVADARYQGVLDRFKVQRESGVVDVHRGFSPAAAQAFPDKHFDWIYIDGLHSYDAVLADLRGWAPKMKDDGLILGDDFANNPSSRSMGFGVIDAVQTFLMESDYGLDFLTFDAYPTFLLSRKPSAGALGSFFASVLRNADVLVRIDKPETMIFEQIVANFSDGCQKMFYAFR